MQTFLHAVILLALSLLPASCGAGEAVSGIDASGTSTAGTNRAHFTYSVDLHGVRGTLEMDVEVVSQSGIVWGPGNRPSIRGVIGTGNSTIYTAGRLTSPNANYTFRGENEFADFTDLATSQRFRVRWQLTPRGLLLTANPFGPGPTTYECVLTDSQRR